MKQRLTPRQRGLVRDLTIHLSIEESEGVKKLAYKQNTTQAEMGRFLLLKGVTSTAGEIMEISKPRSPEPADLEAGD